ncbi:DUF6283 family protein [Umezawaea sp. NPDC059074]|uniref:DUF6283 family protein n=1 Tax=Umezawaea sp. NPDC059074 TaxID=3346716 RepID=UPI0036AC3599
MSERYAGPTVSVYDGASGWGVLSVQGSGVRFRTELCGPETLGPDVEPCPWRADAPVGTFPPEAFQHSARTAHDLSEGRFGCHNSADPTKPLTCAGFLLRGAQHNLEVRVNGPDEALISDGGHELYASYRAMAVANGVDPDDPALAGCRDWRDPRWLDTAEQTTDQE